MTYDTGTGGLYKQNLLDYEFNSVPVWFCMLKGLFEIFWNAGLVHIGPAYRHLGTMQGNVRSYLALFMAQP